MVYILIAILIFGFLIFIHELGHFLTAKALDVQVNEFSICICLLYTSPSPRDS